MLARVAFPAEDFAGLNLNDCQPLNEVVEFGFGEVGEKGDAGEEVGHVSVANKSYLSLYTHEIYCNLLTRLAAAQG